MSMKTQERSPGKKSIVHISLFKQKSAIFDLLLVVSIAAFLRFYFVHTTELDFDQAILFQMASDAIRHGLLPLTSNAASINIYNPPFFIYLLMIPAFFTENPVGGAILICALSTLAVGLSYLFGRRYFGRAVGLIAALLYAVAAGPLNYSRFIWQPNVLPFFVILYLFAIFRGVYDRRKGWLMCALPLMGVIYQLHPSSAVIAILLVVGLILAPRTVRWYEWIVGGGVLAIMFFPYIWYLVLTHFADLEVIKAVAGKAAHIDNQAVKIYWGFITPFWGGTSTHPHSIVKRIMRGLIWLKYVAPVLVIGGALLAAVWMLRGTQEGQEQRDDQAQQVRGWRRILHSWSSFRANPFQCAMAILLIWQAVPLAYFTRHQVDLHAQYFFIVLPGPFILTGLFLVWLANWLHRRWPIWNILRSGVYAFTVLVILTQLVGGVALMLDNSYGHYNDRMWYPYHNASYDIQQALREAEQLADEQHIERIFMTSDTATYDSFNYLVPQMKRNVTVFDTPACFVLPAPSAGPVVLLVDPYNPLTSLLLKHFSESRLVKRLPRMAGEPFKLYIVAGKPLPATVQKAFPQELSLVTTQTEKLTAFENSWQVSHWQIEHSEQSAFRTHYRYVLTATAGGRQLQTSCSMNRMQAGDQLLVSWGLPQKPLEGKTMTVRGSYDINTPVLPAYGPWRLDTFRFRTSTRPLVMDTQDKKGVVLSIS